VELNARGKVSDQQKFSSKRKTFDERFPEIVTSFQAWVSKIEVQPDIGIEAAIYIQNARATISISSVIGAAKAILLAAGFNPVEVNNKSWKKDILGKGNASKEDIMSYAKNRWGHIFEEQDFADAACIAAWRIEHDK
jgi:Holliday junction resolvasome RuvABC endonuclease subunit